MEKSNQTTYRERLLANLRKAITKHEIETGHGAGFYGRMDDEGLIDTALDYMTRVLLRQCTEASVQRKLNAYKAAHSDEIPQE